MYHSALKPELGDAVIIGVSSAEQLSQNLDSVEAGPLSNVLARKFEGVWLSSKKLAPKDHSSFFEREKDEKIEKAKEY